jgi:hypothetical protein
MGYVSRLKDMTEQFDAKAAEIRAMFSNQLEPKRTAEIRERNCTGKHRLHFHFRARKC